MGKAAMRILAEHDLLRTGMEVEPVPGILPPEAQQCLPEFRAVILNPNGGPDSVQWRGKSQSLSQMLGVLQTEYGVKGLYGVNRNFRIVGHETSLREEAEALPHTQQSIGQDNQLETLEEESAGSSNHSTTSEGRTLTNPPPRSRFWDYLEKIAIPVIISVLTAALLALLGLSR